MAPSSGFDSSKQVAREVRVWQDKASLRLNSLRSVCTDLDKLYTNKPFTMSTAIAYVSGKLHYTWFVRACVCVGVCVRV